MKCNLFVDDLRTGPCNGWTETQKGWENWIVVRSVENAKWFLQQGLVENLSLDNDMGKNSETGLLNPTGLDLVKWMIESGFWPEGVITIHSENFINAQRMKDDIDMYRPNFDNA